MEEKIKVIIKLPVVVSMDLEIKCHTLIKYNNGLFRSEEEKAKIIGEILAEYNRSELPAQMAERISGNINGTDIGIIYNGHLIKGKKNRIWYFAFIMDDKGVRLSFKQSCFWKKAKRSPAPFSKERYEDTAHRRREQNTGETKSSYEWTQVVTQQFKRRSE